MPSARRLPGQSLRDRWQGLVDSRLLLIIFGPLMFWGVAIGAWSEAHSPELSPLFWIGLAILVTGIAAIFCIRLLPQARALVRGERGELLVAEHLEDLRALGYQCFHDLVRDGFNIDHVLIGPSGVYAIETKYRSGSGVIEFRNGQGIFIGGREDERDCLKQARGSAYALHKLIHQQAGIRVWVKPLVVFVGDWKVEDDWRSTDVRVLTTEGLPDYFAEQQPELPGADIRMISSHLNRTARVE